LESIREHIKNSVAGSPGYYELKQHKLWFDECSKLIDQMEQAKLVAESKSY
jgi:hypothetical protein